MEIIPLLKQFGLNEKEVKAYLALVEQGPLSVRQLAQVTGINRGTAYDTLKALKALGLVSYYHKATKQFFAAEDPGHLQTVLEEKEKTLHSVKQELQEVIPLLRSLYHKAGDKPVVKYYEGARGAKTILQDVLETTAAASDKTYRIFSSSAIRPFLYKAWKEFTDERIRRKLTVEVIAMGHAGTKAPLAKRKSMSQAEGPPTYLLLYPGKVAMISVNKDKELLGLIIEDEAIFQTHLQMFNFLWNTL